MPISPQETNLVPPVPALDAHAAPPQPGVDLSRLTHATGLYVEPDCFARADLALVFPHLSSLLTGPVDVGSGAATAAVALRNARLDPTLSPLLQLGAFRFGPGYGELALSYRFLATEGNDLVPGVGGAAATSVRSRLNLQTVSLDYLRNDCPVGRDVVLGWEAGVRLQVAFFDTQASAADSFEQARNYFFGAGPHAGFGVSRRLPSGLALFGRLDGALIVGYNTTQNFVATINVPPSGLVSGTFAQQQTEVSPFFVVQTGVEWSPARLPACRLRGGYQFEQWYNLGRVGDSRGDLSAHGLFAGCWVGF